MTNKQYKWLLNQIASWRLQGIIDEETEKQILTSYKVEPKKQDYKLYLILSILGCILIGLGIILILAKNWANLPRLVRVFLSIIPFVIGSIAGIIATNKSVSTATQEGISIFTTIGIITAVVMNGQIYHVVENQGAIFLTIGLLCLPLAYFYESVLTILVYMIIVIGYIFATMDQLTGYTILIYLLLIGGIIPYSIKLHKIERETIPSFWCDLFLIITGASFIFALTHVGLDPKELYFEYITILILLDYFLINRQGEKITTVFGKIGRLAFYLLLFSFMERDIWEIQYSSNYTIIRLGMIVCMICLLGIIQRKQKLFIYQRLGIIAFLSIIIASSFFGKNVYIPVVVSSCFSIILAGLSIRMLVCGLKENNIGKTNKALFLIGAQIFYRFFDMDFSFLVKGIVFIMCGVTCIVINKVLLQKRRGEENEE